MTESRQVRRARERHNKKDTDKLFNILELYYIPMKRKSQAGVEYIYYKKIIDKQGLRNNVSRTENTINKGQS